MFFNIPSLIPCALAAHTFKIQYGSCYRLIELEDPLDPIQPISMCSSVRKRFFPSMRSYWFVWQHAWNLRSAEGQLTRQGVAKPRFESSRPT